jgi:biopolymer transport protein ExbD
MAGRAGLGGDDDSAPFGDINIIPLVDVVLVLLVIFMIAAPMVARQKMDLNLPKAHSSDSKIEPRTLGITITSVGQVLINGSPVDLPQLQNEIKKAVGDNPDLQAIISADVDIKHGLVVDVLDAVRQAGVQRFAIEVERKK